MHPAQIADLLHPFLTLCHSEPAKAGEACPERSRRESVLLSPLQLQSISTYIDILLRWNARINLTAIRNEEEIVTRHFGESLFAACQLFPKSPSVPASVSPVSSVLKDVDVDFDFANDQRPTTNDRVADLGSGAGFPGIPLKLWAPEIKLTLIESNQKKAAFLREITRALTLTDVDIQNTRAESITQTYDVLTLRAVERFDQILPVAASLLGPGARLALLIGAAQASQAQSALPHLLWQAPIPIPESASRVLLISTSR